MFTVNSFLSKFRTSGSATLDELFNPSPPPPIKSEFSDTPKTISFGKAQLLICNRPFFTFFVSGIFNLVTYI